MNKKYPIASNKKLFFPYYRIYFSSTARKIISFHKEKKGKKPIGFEILR